MKVACASISTISLVLLSGIPLFSGIGSTSNFANAKYSNSQAQSFVNECGLDESSGTFYLGVALLVSLHNLQLAHFLNWYY
jgi:hypothetical protein